MRHKIKLSISEKIRAWLELCDFSFQLMKRNLKPRELARRLKKMKEEHEEKNYRILKGLAKLG